jgi:hypothetical protein
VGDRLEKVLGKKEQSRDRRRRPKDLKKMQRFLRLEGIIQELVALLLVEVGEAKGAAGKR